MTVYDTNKYIEQIKNGRSTIVDDFVFLDLNLYEWLKGKTKEIRIKEFKKIDSFIKTMNASYSFRSTFSKQEGIMNNPSAPFAYKYKIAEKIAKKVFGELLSFCVLICFLLITIIAIQNNQTIVKDGEITINNDGDYEVSIINMSLQAGVENMKVTKMARDMLQLKKKEIDDAMVKLFNEVIDIFNKRSSSIKFNYVKSKHLNCNELTSNKSIRISEEDINKYVDVLVSSKNNEDDTKHFFKKIIKSIIIENKSFEFNHISDLYMDYVSYRLGYNYSSKDGKRVEWSTKA